MARALNHPQFGRIPSGPRIARALGVVLLVGCAGGGAEGTGAPECGGARSTGNAKTADGLTCEQCLEQRCCAEWAACAAIADCKEIPKCWAACPEDEFPACQLGCYDQHPAGKNAWIAARKCVDAQRCLYAWGSGGFLCEVGF